MKTHIEKKNNKFVKRYLWIFLSYFALLFLGVIITLVELNVFYGGEEEIILSFGAAFIGLIVLVFNVYNIIVLIKMLRSRSSAKLIWLCLSETLLLIYVLFSVFASLTFLNLLWIILTVKIAQLIFIIYLLIQYKKDKR